MAPTWAALENILIVIGCNWLLFLTFYYMRYKKIRFGSIITELHHNKCRIRECGLVSNSYFRHDWLDKDSPYGQAMLLSCVQFSKRKTNLLGYCVIGWWYWNGLPTWKQECWLTPETWLIFPSFEKRNNQDISNPTHVVISSAFTYILSLSINHLLPLFITLSF